MSDLAVGARPRVAALATCHNRRELTLASLAALYKAADVAEIDLSVFLVDDGSTDGTGAAVRAAFPGVSVIDGDGSLYWCGGMQQAWNRATHHPTDFYLWLNDDLTVHPRALADLLECYRDNRDIDGGPVVTGCTRDPDTDEPTYGGYRIASRWSKLKFRYLHAGEIECDTMHGNFLLLPANVVETVGTMDPVYRHAFGDIDYGFRVRRAGFRILQAPKIVGTQTLNTGYHEKTARLTLKNYRFILFDPKGVPLREWSYFCRRHGGWMWPVNFGYRYVRMIAKGLFGACAGKHVH